MEDIDLERCLTMASYFAFLVIRKHLGTHPSLSLDEVIELARRTSVDAENLDYLGAIMLHAHVPHPLDALEHGELLRQVIASMIEASPPWWLQLVPYGRENVRGALAPDQDYCFRVAGLFDPVPSVEIVAWWDELGGKVRDLQETDRMLQARAAERLSLRLETERVLTFGIQHSPKWVSLEDNSLGYDILSYELSQTGPVPRLIEVKSTQRDQIFITRNEWKNAESAMDRYVFHIWTMPQETLVEMNASEMALHIPRDIGRGQWDIVRVTIA